jgi:hypothetical protein
LTPSRRTRSENGVEWVELLCTHCGQWLPVTSYFFTKRAHELKAHPLERCRACEREKNRKHREAKRGRPVMTPRERKGAYNELMRKECEKAKAK